MSTKITIACFAAFVLVGCATPKHNYTPVSKSISEPPIGEVVERQVGDEMVHQGRYREHDAIQVSSPIKPNWAYTVMPGYFLKTGADDEGEFYRLGGDGPESGSVQRNPLADPLAALMVKKESILCAVTVFSVAACSSTPGGFEKVKRPITTAD